MTIHILRGETSYTPDFVKALRSHLPPKYEVYTEGRIGDEHGVKIPDVIIVKKDMVKTRGTEVLVETGGVVAVVETKKSEKQAYDGLRQAVQYATFQLRSKIGFASNYREVIPFVLGSEARIGRKQGFGSEVTPGTVEACADYIASVVAGKTTLVQSAEESVELLRNAVSAIAEDIKEIDAEELKSPLGLMDELIWKEEEESLEEVDAAIRKASVYLIVNQALFYNALSSQIHTLRPLRPIRTMSDLQEYFSEAYEIDYEPIFLPQVAEKLPDRAVASVNDVISIITELQIDRLKHDILGPLFHQLIPLPIRKRLAAYYTDNSSADLLARLSVEHEDDRVLDLSCGSGTLLVSCYNAKKGFSSETVSPGALHRKFLKEIYGCDITYFAAHLAAINLALREPLAETSKVLITARDAFKLKPFGSTAFLTGKPSTHSVTHTGRGAGFEIPEVSVVIQNPPFTSSKRIEGPYKESLEATLSHKKRYFRKGMGLHAYFVLHSDDFVKDPGGRYAAVLPGSMFNSDYGEGVKQLLLDKYSIEYFVTSDAHVNFSEGVNFKEVLLVARKVDPRRPNNRMTKFIVLRDRLTLTNSPDLAEAAAQVDENVDTDQLSMLKVTRDELASEWNWMAFTKPLLLQTIRKIKKNPKVKTGRDVIRFREGLVLVSPEFFYLPNKHWDLLSDDGDAITIQSTSTSQRLKIEARFLKKATRRPELHTKISPPLDHRLLLIPPDTRLSSDLEEYIRHGEALEFKRQPSPREKIPYILAYCKKKGIPWYSYVWSDMQTRKAQGHLGLIEKFRVKSRPCLAHYFDDTTTGSNNYSFGTTGDESSDKVLAAWFNSSIFLCVFLTYKREIAGDYSRWKIADLNRYPCIDPNTVDPRDAQEICDELDRVRRAELPPIPQQIGKSPRRELDLALLDALRIPDETVVLDNIYRALDREMEKLR